MAATKVRDFTKRGDAIEIPDLTEVQARAYDRFLQLSSTRLDRDTGFGLESLVSATDRTDPGFVRSGCRAPHE